MKYYKRVLDLIEIFITKGEDNDAKHLGVLMY